MLTASANHNERGYLNIYDSDRMRNMVQPRLPTNSGDIIKQARFQVFNDVESSSCNEYRTPNILSSIDSALSKQSINEM